MNNRFKMTEKKIKKSSNKSNKEILQNIVDELLDDFDSISSYDCGNYDNCGCNISDNNKDNKKEKDRKKDHKKLIREKIDMINSLIIAQGNISKIDNNKDDCESINFMNLEVSDIIILKRQILQYEAQYPDKVDEIKTGL